MVFISTRIMILPKRGWVGGSKGREEGKWGRGGGVEEVWSVYMYGGVYHVQVTKNILYEKVGGI